MGKIPRGASGGPSPNQVYLLSEGREISHYDFLLVESTRRNDLGTPALSRAVSASVWLRQGGGAAAEGPAEAQARDPRR